MDGEGVRIDTEFEKSQGLEATYLLTVCTWTLSWWTVTLESLSLMAGKKNKLAGPSTVGMRK